MYGTKLDYHLKKKKAQIQDVHLVMFDDVIQLRMFDLILEWFTTIGSDSTVDLGLDLVLIIIIVYVYVIYVQKQYLHLSFILLYWTKAHFLCIRPRG